MPRIAVPFTLNEGAKEPVYSSKAAIGLDLYAHINFRNDGVVTLRPGQRFGVPTGVKMAIPEGYYGRVAPKSGLASKAGLDVLAGVIDPDYRGEIIVLLVNLGQAPFVIHNHEKIAQLIFERAEQAYVYQVDELDETIRGAGGFGSTGSW